MTIKWNCEKSGCYVNNVLPDWAMLDGCFPDGRGGQTNVKGSDVDGYIHQNGAVLFLEKKFPGGWLNEPQMRAITTLVNQGNSFIVIWCTKANGEDITKMRVFGIDGYDSQIRVDATLRDFRTAVQKWWEARYERGKV